jgi:hypothetical protein
MLRIVDYEFWWNEVLTMPTEANKTISQLKHREMRPTKAIKFVPTICQNKRVQFCYLN